MPRARRSRLLFVLKHIWIPLGIGALLLALAGTNLDRAVSGWFYAAAAGRFYLRYNSMLETVMHQWAKYLVVLLACSVTGAWLFSFAAERLRPWRRLLLFLGLSLALAPGTVAVLKPIGSKHCPYDLAEYGGFAPYRALLEPPPPDVKAAHCLLSGHASTGFALLAFYFVGLALRRPRLALTGLWAGLAAGLIFGLTRVAQGAHFLSGILWPGLICWLVILVLYVALFGARDDARAEIASASPDPDTAVGRGEAPDSRPEPTPPSGTPAHAECR